MRRLNALADDLGQSGRASATHAQIFNQLAAEAEASGIPSAKADLLTGFSSMSVKEMRMLLNQIKAQL